MRSALVLAAAALASGCATTPRPATPADPLEPFNRAMYAIHEGFARAVPGSAGIVSMRGKVSAASSAAAGRMRTRTSYQPAWPVTGSEFEIRSPSPLGEGRGEGSSSSEIKWFRMNPRLASFASASRRHAPGALPIAFQVHTVPGSTASE